MRKLLITTAVVGSFLFVGVGGAFANIIQVFETPAHDVYGDLNNPVLVSGGSNYDYSHDIRSPYWTYTPGTDILSLATLTITLGDDADSENQPEAFEIQLLTDNTIPTYGTTLITYSDKLSFSSVGFGPYDVITSIEVNPDGLLSVRLHPTNSGQDFYFYQSVLDAEWYHEEDDGNITPGSAATPVPEPASMLLLGTGLVGFAGAARRRKKNQA